MKNRFSKKSYANLKNHLLAPTHSCKHQVHPENNLNHQKYSQDVKSIKYCQENQYNIINLLNSNCFNSLKYLFLVISILFFGSNSLYAAASNSLYVAPINCHSLEVEIPNFWQIVWMEKSFCENYRIENNNKPFDFQNQLDWIKNLKTKKKKVSLILGRSTKEGLKNTNYHNYEDHIWAFANNIMSPSNDHPHFLINFSELSFLRKIPENTFHSIIFDSGVSKDLGVSDAEKTNVKLTLKNVFQEYHRILEPKGQLILPINEFYIYEDINVNGNTFELSGDDFFPNKIKTYISRDAKESFLKKQKEFGTRLSRLGGYNELRNFDKEITNFSFESPKLNEWGFSNILPRNAARLAGLVDQKKIVDEKQISNLLKELRDIEKENPNEIAINDARQALNKLIVQNFLQVFSNVEIKNQRKDGNTLKGIFIFATK